MGTHMGSECYLPPGRADIPAFTPAKAGTRISDPEGIQGFLTVYTANNTFIPLLISVNFRNRKVYWMVLMPTKF